MVLSYEHFVGMSERFNKPIISNAVFPLWIGVSDDHNALNKALDRMSYDYQPKFSSALQAISVISRGLPVPRNWIDALDFLPGVPDGYLIPKELLKRRRTGII